MLLTVVLLFITWCGTAAPASNGRLQAIAGDAPYSVRITAPKRLTDLGKGTYSKWVGCSYSIEWGDGSFAPSGPVGANCAPGLSHAYSKTGTYHIRAKIFHPAPDDHHIDDWSDSVTFTVK